MKLTIRLGTAALAALVLALGCDKKGPTQPIPSTNATIQTLWPNQDGRSWNYRIVARQWDAPQGPYYQSRDSVPPIPSMSQLAALLGTQPIGSNPVSDTATFQLKFQGQITTASGVTAQHLVETMLRPGPGAVPRYAGSAMPSGFMQELVRARPDLARRLALFGAARASQDTLVQAHSPLFLFGYAWRRTSEWIGSYGDVDTALAWKYLTKNLAPGSEFTHQLVPSLATDVFLHGRILNRQTIQTPGGTFRDAVVCLYSVDYGISEAVDESGNVAGYVRFYSYGTVTYADSVGPVASYERLRVASRNQPLGFADQSLALSSRSAARLVASRSSARLPE